MWCLIVLLLVFEWGRLYFKSEVVTDMYFNVTAVSIAIVGYYARAIIVHYFILVAGCIMLVAHIVFQHPLRADMGTIENFSLTEYLTIFIAFIYGSIASRFFNGWGIMISRFDWITFSKEHVAWTLLAFGLLIDIWWGSWPREKFISLNIKYFILSLFVPIIFYVLTAVIFPVVKNGEAVDLRQFFESHKKIIYLLFGITLLANGITANVMEQQWTDAENLFRLGAFLFSLAGVFTKRVIIERIVLVLGWIMLIAHTIAESKF